MVSRLLACIPVVLLCSLATARAAVIINEIHADPAPGIAGDTNRDGVRDASQDEFVELVNTGAAPLALGAWTLADARAVRHVFPASATLAPHQAVVVFGGGTPRGGFGGARVQIASSGRLSLNNGGDTVTLSNAAGIVGSVSFSMVDDASLTRIPELTGGFVPHGDVPAALGALHSPGTRIDGAPFRAPHRAPEPAALALMAIGLGLGGFALSPRLGAGVGCRRGRL